MARHNIQFRGIRHAPSDITGQDGDLLECVNLVHEGGELKPIEMPEFVGLGTKDMSLAAVHNVSGKRYFVYVRNVIGGSILILDENNDYVYDNSIPGESVKWVETVGNTVIFGTSNSIYYLYYKNGVYKWLGDKMPQPVFEFDMGKNWGKPDMAGYTDESKFYSVYDPKPYCVDDDGNTPPGGGIQHTITDSTVSSSTNVRYIDLMFPKDENKKIIRDNLRAKMADIVSTSKKDGRFIYPFFLRYAAKMFDGSYVMHSAPILMLPSTLQCPVLAYLYNHHYHNSEASGDYKYAHANLALVFKAKSLRLRFKGFYDENGVETSIDDWEDIIKGVDVFMSSQIVTFDDSYYDNVKNIPERYYNPSQCTGEDIAKYTPDYGFDYSRNGKSLWFENHQQNGFQINTNSYQYYGYYYKNFYFPLKSVSKDILIEKMRNINLFYKVKSFSLNELKEDDITRWGYFHDKIEYGLLERLETLPTLPDDYISRCRIASKTNYNYNQRLVLGDIKLQAPKWYHDTKAFSNYIYDVSIWFKIEKQDKTIWIKYTKLNAGQYDFAHFVFYPDQDCKEIIIQKTGDMWRSIKIEPHATLNGACALMPDLQSMFEYLPQCPRPGIYSIGETDRYYDLHNTLAMSTVANPFHFSASNFRDIGRTNIIGIAANTLDVSSGQWGQYPLHVFCSDGIVAVAIDSEGKFGGTQAVSADVLREPIGLSQPTLIQTGQALLFLTQRGVMTIAGTQIKCISEVMNGRHFNPLKELYPINNIVSSSTAQDEPLNERNGMQATKPSVLLNIDGALSDCIEWSSGDTDFNTFAREGFLAYDYAHNRVLLLNEKFTYHYVFDIDTGLWSKGIVTRNGDVKTIHAAVNNYTEMYLQDYPGWLYKTMDVTDENVANSLFQYGYFISRPVRFGTDEYKTITRILHRYTDYEYGSYAKLALYGSRDGVKYGRVNTLRGMGYKYFIFVVYTYLKPNERYSYMSVDFETRLTNKLR